MEKPKPGIVIMYASWALIWIYRVIHGVVYKQYIDSVSRFALTVLAAVSLTAATIIKHEVI